METHDPDNNCQAMGRALYDVVWPCLSPKFVSTLANRVVPPFDTSTVAENKRLCPIHVETGKRVYQLYAELDEGDQANEALRFA